MANSSTSAAKIGMILTRIAVPAWVALGAAVKLSEINPETLPGRTIGPVVQALPVDPALTLAAIIGLEFLVVAIMLTMAPLARPVAVGTLGVYCAVLFGEMAQGATTSGCLGSFSPVPLVMLIINGALLLAVLLFDPTELIRASTYNLARAAAIILAAAGFTISFKVTLDAKAQQPLMSDNGESPGEDSAPLQLNLVSPSGTQRVASPPRH
jgi:hypothetical protein